MANTEIFVVLEVSQAAHAEDKARLEAALAASPVASVLLTAAPGVSLLPAPLKALIEFAQSRGTAALIADDAGLARKLKADGVHLSWSKTPHARYAEAREILGERFIIGADAGRSRHDAMELAEAGVAYVGFGIPGHVEDRATAFTRQQDLVAWWSEIFEIPCIAFDVADADAARALTEAGADFVAVTLSAGMPPQTIVRHIEAFRDALGAAKAMI